MKVRLLNKIEIKKAAAIVRQNYSPAWEKSSALELHDMFGNGAIKPVYFVAEENGEIVGFAGYIQSWMDYDVYEIFWVNVTPNKQGQGIGKELMKKVISEIKKKKKSSLILLSATPSNSKYYKQHFGFKVLRQASPGHNLMALVLS